MKTISLCVPTDDYEAFRRAAREQGRPVAQLIREAMSSYRSQALERRRPQLEHIPVLVGHRMRSSVPARAETYEEVFGYGESSAQIRSRRS